MNLVNLLNKGKIDDNTLRLRINRLRDLYHAFEEFDDELAVLNPIDIH